MKHILVTLIFLAFSVISFCQNVNLIIQVNEKLVESGISKIELKFGNEKDAIKIPVDYVPGNLILSETAWSLINSDTLNHFILQFDYSTFSKDDQEIAFFFVELSKNELFEPFLILNIYDFRDKKYRKWYQWHTDKDFLAELRYPGKGIYIRKK